MSVLPPPAALALETPLLLWGLLLAIPLTLFHLYHRRRVVVPFLPLLVEALGPRRPGGGLRRPRDLASLLLRLGALVLLVLALAGLAPAQAGPPPEALVLVVDADVTAGAVEADGRPRYAHALDLARALVRERAWREVAVVEARESPRVLVGATRERAAAAAVLARLRADVERGSRGPADSRADLGAARALGLDLARERRPSRLVVLTARALESGAASTDDVPVEVLGTGRTRDDQGLTACDVASAADGVHSVVRLGVRNDADARRRRDLVLSVGGEEVLRTTLDLGPGEVVGGVEHEVLPPRDGGWLEARLEGRDAFDLDDAALAWLAPPVRPSVLVVHQGGVRPYTRAVLEAMGDLIDVEASGTVEAANLPRAAPRDVTIVDGATLPAGALRPGAWLFLAPLGGALPFEVGDPVREPLVWRSAPDHPLLVDVDLGEAWIARGFPVKGEGLVSLAEADGATVLGEGERDGVRYVVLGLDPEGSDLPLRAALPLLVRAAVRRLAAVPVAPLEPCYAAGAPLRPRLPLVGGPEARLAWSTGEAVARLDPGAEAFRIPAGARGRVIVTTPRWTGRTAFVDLDPARTIVPARDAATPPRPPPPARSRPCAGDARSWPSPSSSCCSTSCFSPCATGVSGNLTV